MTFKMRDEYVKVLDALAQRPKTGEEICADCHFESRLDCTGAISILRRVRAIEPMNREYYQITLKGKELRNSVVRIAQR